MGLGCKQSKHSLLAMSFNVFTCRGQCWYSRFSINCRSEFKNMTYHSVPIFHLDFMWYSLPREFKGIVSKIYLKCADSTCQNIFAEC